MKNKKNKKNKKDIERAEKGLQNILSAAGRDDNDKVIPLSGMKSKIEAKTNIDSVATSDQKMRSGFNFRAFIRKPAYSITLAALTIIIIISAVIPLKYKKTIGYEVAFSGVNKDLYDDDNVFCDLLQYLGLNDADIDFQGCQASCSLVVIDLKTEEEAMMVVSAFTQIDTDKITPQVITIQTNEMKTLLDQANEKFLN
ncbi:MAG: hypothetical protein V3V99_02080 [candidate division Zixibacteria bacterium]